MKLSSKKGSVLITVLVLLLTITLGTVGLYQYVVNSRTIDELKNDNIVAFYAAESGVNKVIHFFNHPEDYAVNPNLFVYDEDNLRFTNLINALSSGNISLSNSVYPTYDLNQAGDRKLGRVTELIIMPPSATDPVTCFAKIKSVGKTYNAAAKRNVSKTVYMYIFDNQGWPSGSPAGIISKSASNFNGDVTARWGQVWSKGICDLPNSSIWRNFIDLNDPGWTGVLTDSYFLQQGGKYMDGSKNGSDTPLTPAAGERYYNPCVFPCYLGQYDGRFLQHQELNFPEFNYYKYKEIALKRGEYYSTDAAGNIYRDGIEDAAHKIKSFDDEFCSANPTTSPNRFIFIDTIDGNAPNSAGTNLVDINIAGGSPHSKGFFYLCANVHFSGMGNSPTVTVQNPANQNVSLSKLWLNGMAYVSGFMDITGNPVIYGSIIIERGIRGRGNPNVYYNYRLKNGTWFPVGSRVEIRLYRVV